MAFSVADEKSQESCAAGFVGSKVRNGRSYPASFLTGFPCLISAPRPSTWGEGAEGPTIPLALLAEQQFIKMNLAVGSCREEAAEGSLSPSGPFWNMVSITQTEAVLNAWTPGSHTRQPPAGWGPGHTALCRMGRAVQSSLCPHTPYCHPASWVTCVCKAASRKVAAACGLSLPQAQGCVHVPPLQWGGLVKAPSSSPELTSYKKQKCFLKEQFYQLINPSRINWKVSLWR